MDVPDSPGWNQWHRLIVGSLNCWKGTVQKGSDSEELGRVDVIRWHGLAVRKDWKKVCEKDVEVIKLLFRCDDWDGDGQLAIDETDMLWKKETTLVCKRIYQYMKVHSRINSNEKIRTAMYSDVQVHTSMNKYKHKTKGIYKYKRVHEQIPKYKQVWTRMYHTL